MPAKHQHHPATPRSDSVFGVVSGSILGIATACVGAIFVQATIPMFRVALAGLVIGAAIGGITGMIKFYDRDSFNTSDLGVKLGIVFFVLPAVIQFLGAAGFATGRASAILVVASAFAGLMAGLIVGSILDRVYESILRRWAQNAEAEGE